MKLTIAGLFSATVLPPIPMMTGLFINCRSPIPKREYGELILVCALPANMAIKAKTSKIVDLYELFVFNIVSQNNVQAFNSYIWKCKDAIF